MLGILELFVQSPSISVKSFLTTFHLLGLVFGLGAATMLDLIILRFLIKNRVAGEHWSIIEFLSKSVTIGLVLLWLSGFGFLLHYALFDADKLANPKIWAKISIVAVLTINGIFIHRIVLPQIHARVGRHLFQGMSASRKSLLLVLGTISCTSWYVPLILGAIPLFNFTLSVTTFLALYAAVVLGAISVALIVSRWVLPLPPTVTISRRKYLALRRAARGATPSEYATQSSIRLHDSGRARHAGIGRFLSGSKRAEFGAAVLIIVGFPIVAGAVVHGSARPLAIEHLPNTATSVEGKIEAAFSNFEQALFVPTPLASLDAASARLSRPQNDAGSEEESPTRPTSSTAVAPGVETSTRPAKADAARTSSRVFGVWAPDSSTCMGTPSQNGLRATINAEGAWAGDTACVFRQKEAIRNGWKVVAACSNRGERWTADAKLVVDGDQLTWSSQRGTSTYVRCYNT